jgi:hypothetical protein
MGRRLPEANQIQCGGLIFSAPRRRSVPFDRQNVIKPSPEHRALPVQAAPCPLSAQKTAKLMQKIHSLTVY